MKIFVCAYADCDNWNEYMKKPDKCPECNSKEWMVLDVYD